MNDFILALASLMEKHRITNLEPDRESRYHPGNPYSVYSITMNKESDAAIIYGACITPHDLRKSINKCMCIDCREQRENETQSSRKSP